MTRLPGESLIDFTLRFLHFREAETQHSLHPSGALRGSGEPQPGVRMLDTCEDIAQEYSRLPIVGMGKIDPMNTASEKSIISALELVVDCGCETVVDTNQYGDKYCFGDTVGVCKFCGIRVCSECLKYETCTDSRSRWHRLEP